MKVAIIGGRDFKNKELLNQVMQVYKPEISIIVSGGAIGADSLGEEWAQLNNIPTEIYLPDWKTYGKSAGFRRNKTIVCNSDLVIAFWDGKSRGTANSISIARLLHKQLNIISY